MQVMLPNPLLSSTEDLPVLAWKPGKALDMAVSPDGKYLAVSYLDTVRLYSVELLTSGTCDDSMRDAEVRPCCMQHSSVQAPAALRLRA